MSDLADGVVPLAEFLARGHGPNARVARGGAAPREPLVDGLPPIRVKPLNLPLEFEDLTETIPSFSPAHLDRATVAFAERTGGSVRLYQGGRRFVTAHRVTRVSTYPVGPDAQGLQGVLCDRKGVGLAFRTTEPAPALQRYFEKRRNAPLYLMGRLVKEGGRWALLNPEPVATRWIGRVRPIYPVHSKTLESQLSLVDDIDVSSYLAQGRVQNVYSANIAAREEHTVGRGVAQILLDGLKCRQSIRAALGDEGVKRPDGVLSQLLRSIHNPATLEEARTASDAIDLIGAVAELSSGIEAAFKEDQRLRRMRRKPKALEKRARQNGYRDYVDELTQTLPFTLTTDQNLAIRECLHAMDDGRPMRRLLLGDVGSGKTAVFGMVCRAMVRAGGRVAILIPNANLARQVHRHMLSWIPETPAEFIAGKARPEKSNAQLVVGTTSVNAKCAAAFDLVVVDEQHRFSRQQREAAMAARAHLLEATATPIPRTQALVQLGVLQVSTLKGCPVEKHITTRIWLEQDKTQLFAGVSQTVKRGRQVLVIYPAKHHAPLTDEEVMSESTPMAEDEADAQPDAEMLYSVTQFYDTWNKAFPGRVRMAHGGLAIEENQNALDDMAAGTADILICTTIVEVGVDLPGLERVIVVQAQRFGASTLHQLRGRVARAGGVGYCDLYAPGEVASKSLERLRILEECTDGFEIAKRDLALRGGGDATIFGHRQSGRKRNFLFPHRVIPPSAQVEASRRLQLEWFGDRELDD